LGDNDSSIAANALLWWGVDSGEAGHACKQEVHGKIGSAHPLNSAVYSKPLQKTNFKKCNVL
jgi:hypothetical protein